MKTHKKTERFLGPVGKIVDGKYVHAEGELQFNDATGEVYEYSKSDRAFWFCGNLMNRTHAAFARDYFTSSED